MSYIIDRIILITISCFVLVQSCTMKEIVILGLLAVVIAGISYYFDAKKVSIGFGWLYMVCAIFLPNLIFISPVVMYELFAWKRYIEMGLLAVLNIVSLIYIEDVSIMAVLLIVFGEILACLLFYRSNQNEELHELVKHIRDDSEERTILLAEKNKHLIEKQDQEIYVATLKERNRIAREIHDNVGHMITRSILQMGALMTINKEEPLHGQLESVKNNLDVAMNNIRESVHDLHDESIDLKQALQDVVKELDGRFDCKLDYDAGNNIDRRYKYAIIGIVKEAVSNVIKHSQNDKVDVILREHPGMYQLVVHDYKTNSKSLAGSKAGASQVWAKKETDGIGLQNMQDRVATLKGNISIDRSNGFKIFVTLPRLG